MISETAVEEIPDTVIRSYQCTESFADIIRGLLDSEPINQSGARGGSID